MSIEPTFSEDEERMICEVLSRDPEVMTIVDAARNNVTAKTRSSISEFPSDRILWTVVVGEAFEALAITETLSLAADARNDDSLEESDPFAKELAAKVFLRIDEHGVLKISIPKSDAKTATTVSVQRVGNGEIDDQYRPVLLYRDEKTDRLSGVTDLSDWPLATGDTIHIRQLLPDSAILGEITSDKLEELRRVAKTNEQRGDLDKLLERKDVV